MATGTAFRIACVGWTLAAFAASCGGPSQPGDGCAGTGCPDGEADVPEAAPDAADAVADPGLDAPVDAIADPGGDGRVDAAKEAGDAPDDVPPDGPPFDALSCPGVAGTAKTLAQKAATFDADAVRWNLPAGQDLLFNAVLKDDLQTFDHVGMSDNVGMWTSTYTASQALRYAVTRSPEALANLRRTVRGEWNLMRITGVPGLFSRAAIDPRLPGFPSEDWLRSAYADCDLSVAHCKRYNQVTEGEFAGVWFKNDVSKDEYSGHMFAMGVILEVVDDPEILERARDIVTQVGRHLADHGLRITDIDGKVTTYGLMNALSFNDFPGFNAILSLSWTRLAATVAGGDLLAFYRDCLLQASGERECIPDEAPLPYTGYLDDVGLDMDCKTNWNNHNMAQLAMYPLIRFEDDPDVKARYRAALRDSLWDADDPRPMSAQQNPLFTFFYLANRDPADPWPEEAARDAICSMKRFPESKAHHAADTVSRYPETCRDRGDDPLTDVVVPIEERAMDNFLWTGNPYSLDREAEDLRQVDSPEDYLLAYWLGRYLGFISPDM